MTQRRRLGHVHLPRPSHLPRALDHTIYDGAAVGVVFVRPRVAARVHQDDGDGKLTGGPPHSGKGEDVIQTV